MNTFKSLRTLVIVSIMSMGMFSAHSQTIYVSTNGNDANNGQISTPVKTIAKALSLAGGITHQDIYVEAGTYNETQILELKSNVSIEGGWKIVSGLWEKTTTDTTKIFINAIETVSDFNQRIGFRSNNDTNWLLKDLYVDVASATSSDRNASGKGTSVYGLYVTGNTTNTFVVNCKIISGNAGDGANGQVGANGAVGNNGEDGNITQVAVCYGGSATTGGSEVGSGIRKGGTGGNGSEGRNGGVFTSGTGSGPGSNGANGGGGAIGGSGGTTAASGADGVSGGNGASGNSGSTPSTSKTPSWGTYFIPANQGGIGSDGAGGAGGGGGSGGAQRSFVGSWSAGAGGSGGEGGAGGTGGSGGGSSFGVYCYNTVLPLIMNTSISQGQAGQGGVGGIGGIGGNGGTGGIGGSGMSGGCNNSALGGNGGTGGKGGNGGKGEDGVGGASFAILSVSSSGTYSSSFTSLDESLTKAGFTFTGRDTLLIPDFYPYKTYYEIELESGTTMLPTLNHIYFSDENINLTNVTQISSFNNSATVTVETKNNTVVKYHFYFKLLTDVTTNDYLSDLKLDGVTIDGFNKHTFTYDIVLEPGTTTHPEITAFTESSDASIDIIPTTLPGAAKIIVSADNTDYEKIYTIHFVVALSTDTLLSDIKLDNQSIEDFDEEIFSYHIILEPGTTVVPTVTATPQWQTATVEVFPTDTLPGTTTILVTAEDTNYKHAYLVSFEVALSTDTLLTDIKLDNQSIEDFDEEIFSYHIILEPGTTSAPTVTATPQWQTATVEVFPTDTLPGTTTILVTAEDTNYTHTYLVSFEVALSIDTLLANIKLDNQFISNFNKDTFSYHIILEPGTTLAPTVTATPQWQTATVEVFPTDTLPGTTTILVTAEDANYTHTYLVSFEVALSTNALLSDIEIDNISIPDFDETTFRYFVSLPFGSVDFPEVIGISQWATAEVDVVVPASFPGIVQLLVTAEDTNYKKSYYVHFDVDLSINAYLQEIEINGVVFEDFDKDTFEYAVLLPLGTLELPIVNAVSECAMANVYISPIYDLPGTVEILVVAEDANYQQTYSIHFSSELSTDASLLELSVNGREIENFHTDTLFYRIELPYEEGSSHPVLTAVAQSVKAAVSIIEAEEIPGMASVVVKAEDTNYVKEYFIHFTVEAGNNADLLFLHVNDEPLQDFHKDSCHYQYYHPLGTVESPQVNVIPVDARARVDIQQCESLDGKAFITVTSVNGMVTKSYTVTFSLHKNMNARLADIRLDGKTISNFNPYTKIYKEILDSNQNIPNLAVTLEDTNASYVIEMPEEVPGEAVITVLAEDKTTSSAYRVIFERKASQGGGTSITDLNASDYVKIYPNPAKDYIVVDMGENDISTITEIRIFDLSGKQIHQQPITNRTTKIYLDSFAKGAYFIQLRNDKTIGKPIQIIKQ